VSPRRVQCANRRGPTQVPRERLQAVASARSFRGMGFERRGRCGESSRAVKRRSASAYSGAARVQAFSQAKCSACSISLSGSGFVCANVGWRRMAMSRLRPTRRKHGLPDPQDIFLSRFRGAPIPFYSPKQIDARHKIVIACNGRVQQLRAYGRRRGAPALWGHRMLGLPSTAARRSHHRSAEPNRQGDRNAASSIDPRDALPIRRRNPVPRLRTEGNPVRKRPASEPYSNHGDPHTME
jgi:hypothetical protein